MNYMVSNVFYTAKNSVKINICVDIELKQSNILLYSSIKGGVRVNHLEQVLVDSFGDKFSMRVSSVVAVLSVIANGLWGGWTMAMQSLVFFMVLDFFLGVLVGKTHKQLSSGRAYEGIGKKITILVLVAVAFKLDQMMNGEGLIRDMVIFFYVGQEGISIIENAAALGVPIPEKLKDSLVQLQDGNKKDFSEHE